MSECKTIAFADYFREHPGKEGRVLMHTVTLDTMAEVSVGVAEKDDGPTIVHCFRRTQETGERTELRFGLTLEAVRAAVSIYTSLGLLPEIMEAVKDNATLTARCEKLQGEKATLMESLREARRPQQAALDAAKEK